MLNVPGVDPKRIECMVDATGVRHSVYLDKLLIALLGRRGPSFHGDQHSSSDGIAVMVAAFDEWRASGGKRLWPEPPPQPVDCVCGAKSYVLDKGFVECDCCRLAANNVAEWNAIQDTLKKLKEAT